MTTRSLAKLGALAFAVGFVAVASLQAVGQGRISGTVVDENKTLLADVKITAVNMEVASMRVETKTDAKGKWAITLVDSTKPFLYRFEKEGYQPYEMEHKIPIGANERREIVLRSANAVAADAGAGQSTPANNAAMKFNQGVEALRMGDNGTAIARMKEALAENPELLQAHEALAIVYAQDRKWAEAAAEAEIVYAKDPANEKALRVAVDAYKNLGNKEKLAAFQAALGGVDPTTAALDLYNEGVNAYNMGDMKTALGHFQKSFEKNPEYARVYYMLAMCYAAESKNALAKENMEKFIAKAAADDPDLTTAKEMLPYLK